MALPTATSNDLLPPAIVVVLGQAVFGLDRLDFAHDHVGFELRRDEKFGGHVAALFQPRRVALEVVARRLEVGR